MAASTTIVFPHQFHGNIANIIIGYMVKTPTTRQRQLMYELLLSKISPYNHAFLGEAVFGTAQDHNPILATDGLRTCVGFAGREPSSRHAGFLVHFITGSQADHFFAEKDPIFFRGLQVKEIMYSVAY